MISSYEKNHYGELFKYLIEVNKVKNAVELGILHGYSTLHIAKGLQLTGGHLDSYDLFEDYKYKHGSKDEVEKMLTKNNVLDYVKIMKGNAYEVYRNYKDKSIDFLHVDISNTGEVVKKIMKLWYSKIKERGLILFEGGSEERDNIEWMKSYNMSPIRKELLCNELINNNFIWSVYEYFPSMSVLIRIIK